MSCEVGGSLFTAHSMDGVHVQPVTTLSRDTCARFFICLLPVLVRYQRRWCGVAVTAMLRAFSTH